ncbi:recombinase family protein [Paenibacillus polymyxa]|jgi:site-specific DNA recombinase|uniref:recombinase family protein n=1 Tax=Paenibacillus TaxID=44249 RepID=UPI000D2FC15A|nr:MULTISPECIES: recombinase family protein [Paenibacillus]KAF6616196.1 recombinase family protein [Paenibacillus sp. EKM101P]KAF6618030.1 recombinase family protein [Paenibacillus sp. EKM102P]KAF6626044.1 recombinase family protein [Paenibacillus sp. EKM10P]KAF6642603.1 recombinase family protein [Paenibacillus sp. EKM11P]MBY0020936.1 recombinase family protein [Paenibacillus polymyxa]
MAQAVTAKKVVIVPVKTLNIVEGIQSIQKKKVAAYCRVSTDSEEQKESYTNQVNHYTQYIQNNLEWEMADIYADEGITGTSTKNRTHFNRMIQDARNGKLDLILVKSISRFARNTLDLLKYVRELKSLGVAVFFERENINTLDTTGEVLLTILSSLAQDESRNISENSRWGILRGFQNGKVFCNTTRFLGYDKDEHGELVINEPEAEIVRRIYEEYLDGKSYQAIARGLMRDHIRTVTGGDTWWDSSITLILTNEKYYGALLQQKTVTVDFLTHKRIKNRGQEQQYLIENNHEPIVSKEIFETVQKEKKRRAKLKGSVMGESKRYSSKYALSSKVYCGCCEAIFKRRTWNSNNPSKKVVWQCKTYVNEGKAVCDAKSVDEQVLHSAFVRLFNRMYENKERFIKTLKANIESVLSSKVGQEPLLDIEGQMQQLKSDLKELVNLKLRNQIDETVYDEETNRLSSELNELRQQMLILEEEEDQKEKIKERVDEIIQLLNSRQDILEQFDDNLFNALVEKITILSPAHFVFTLKSGMSLDEILD